MAKAVSAQQSLNALVLVGAPAVGGLLAGAFGSGPPLTVDAATFAMVTGAAMLVRTRRRPTGLPADGRSARVPGGFEILRADQVLAPLILGIGLVILLVGMVDVVLVFLIRRTLHAGDGWYGTAGAAWTAGMVAGALGASSITTERVQTWATIAGAGLACVALAPWSQQSGCSCRFQSSAGSGTDTQAHASRPCSSAHTRLRAGTRLSRCERRRRRAQGSSLLIGGQPAAVLRPRTISAIAGLLGATDTVPIAVFHAGRTTRADRLIHARGDESLSC